MSAALHSCRMGALLLGLFLMQGTLLTQLASAGARAGGGVRSSTSSVPKFTPSTPSSFNPFSKTPTAAPSTFSKPGGLSGFSYSRPGYRSSSMILPFAAGALAGSALYSLSHNPSAYCNGFSIQCYKSTCESSLRQCGSTNSTQLVIASCPDTRFSECWQSQDSLFQCFGRRRPSYGGQDVMSYCHSPETGMNAAGHTAAQRPLLLAILALLPVLLTFAIRI